MFSSIQKMYLIGFLHNMIFFGAISVPFFLEWGKLDYTQMFLLQSWFMLWVFVFEVPSGAFADKYGRKACIALTGFFTALGALIYSSIPNFYVFIFAEFLWALGVAFMSGADKALIYDTLKEERNTKKAKYIFSRYQVSGIIGTIVSLPLGSFIASLMILPYPDNLAVPTMLTAVPLSIAVFIALWLREPQRRRHTGNPLSISVKGIKYLANHKSLRALALDYSLISATTFLMFWLYQPLLKSVGIDIVLWGFVAALFNIFAIILLSNIKKIENAFGIRRLLFLSALMPGIMYLLMGFYRPLWLVLSGIFLIVGLNQLRMPLFEHYMNAYIKSKSRATVLSSVSMIRNVILVFLYPLLGLMMDISLNYSLIILGLLTIAFALTSKVDEKMLKD